MIYVLDTCAMRAIGKRTLANVSRSIDLRISPISFLECLSHLDEPVEQKTPQESFKCRKGELIKFQLVKFLDDPFAFHATEIGRREIVNATRFEDSELFPMMLPFLERAETLDSFYESQFFDGDGNRRSLQSVTNRCRQSLEAFEQHFHRQIVKFRREMIRELGEDRLEDLSLDDCITLIFYTVNHLNERYGNPSPTQRVKILVSQYLHLDFLYLLVRDCIRNNGLTSPIAFDRNDAEDSTLCFYLNLMESRTLVTGDRKICRRVTELLEWMKAKVPQNNIGARVLSIAEFRREIGI